MLTCLLAVTAEALPIETTLGNGDVCESLLYVPDGLATHESVPLVMAFHGGGGTAASFQNLTGLNQAADEHGFAVVYLQAEQVTGQAIWGTYRATTGDPSNDLAFVDALVPQLVEHHGIDANRVYATGLSNGGEFTFLLGLTRPDTVAAVAPVAMNLTPALTANTNFSQPIPTLNIVGSEDPLVPFEGGTIADSGDGVLSSANTIAYLREINGLNDPYDVPVVIEPLPNTADDGTRSIRNTFVADEPGEAELQRITVINGGHTWPGSPVTVSEDEFGLTARDFSANDEIWAFFEPRAIPEPGSGLILVFGVGGLLLARRSAGFRRCAPSVLPHARFRFAGELPVPATLSLEML